MNTSPIDTQLHGFCDTSLQAYAAVVYVQSLYQNGHIKVRIVALKTRVSPNEKSHNSQARIVRGGFTI